jgi:hypothetical protein
MEIMHALSIVVGPVNSRGQKQCVNSQHTLPPTRGDGCSAWDEWTKLVQNPKAFAKGG